MGSSGTFDQKALKTSLVVLAPCHTHNCALTSALNSSFILCS